LEKALRRESVVRGFARVFRNKGGNGGETLEKTGRTGRGKETITGSREEVKADRKGRHRKQMGSTNRTATIKSEWEVMTLNKGKLHYSGKDPVKGKEGTQLLVNALKNRHLGTAKADHRKTESSKTRKRRKGLRGGDGWGSRAKTKREEEESSTPLENCLDRGELIHKVLKKEEGKAAGAEEDQRQNQAAGRGKKANVGLK